MKITKVFKTQQFTNKAGKKYYITICELSGDSSSFMVKLLSKAPLSEGQLVQLPYLLVDFQKFAITIEE